MKRYKFFSRPYNKQKGVNEFDLKGKNSPLPDMCQIIPAVNALNLRGKNSIKLPIPPLCNAVNALNLKGKNSRKKN